MDEDEQDEVAEDDYANNFGGLGDEGGLGNIDFSKLGGLGGGGGEDLPATGEEEEQVCLPSKTLDPYTDAIVIQDEGLPDLEEDKAETKT